MQQRESTWTPRSLLEALFARSDDAALDYVTDQLLSDGEMSSPPAAGAAPAADADAELVEAG